MYGNSAARLVAAGVPAAPGSGCGTGRALERRQRAGAADLDQLASGRLERVARVDVGVRRQPDRRGVPTQPGHQVPRAAGADPRHGPPPAAAVGVAERDELAEHMDL